MGLKIAFLSPEYPHEKTGNAGGIGSSIKLLAAGLRDKGVAVSVLVYGQKTDGVFDDNGISVYQIKNIRLKGFSLLLTQKKIQRLIDKLYSESKIQVVEAPDWTGITSFISPKKCPIVIRLHGSDTYFCNLEKRRVKWVNRFLERSALRKADGWLSVSQYTAEKTNEFFSVNLPFTIIHNGIDVTAFKPEERISDPKKEKQILYLGTLIRKKGVLELPHIFNRIVAKNKSVELVLLGKDSFDIATGSKSTFELMKPLFSEEALARVNYPGRVPYREVAKYINEADVCVYPSFAEAFPVSWLEAMAMRKAIVASNIGWAPEVIDSKSNGFLVSPKDHKEFADTVSTLLENETLQEEIGNNAREKVKREFSIDLIAQQNINFYKNIIQ